MFQINTNHQSSFPSSLNFSIPAYSILKKFGSSGDRHKETLYNESLICPGLVTLNLSLFLSFAFLIVIIQTKIKIYFHESERGWNDHNKINMTKSTNLTALNNLQSYNSKPTTEQQLNHVGVMGRELVNVITSSPGVFIN